MFTFCKARWARQKKKQKENHATKVTKIPKTKRRKVHIANCFGLYLYVFKDVTTAFVTLVLVQKIVDSFFVHFLADMRIETLIVLKFSDIEENW